MGNTSAFKLLLLITTLCLFLSVTPQTINSLFKKIHVDTSDLLECDLGGSLYKTKTDEAIIATLVYCAAQCTADDECILFKRQDHTCYFYSLLVTEDSDCIADTGTYVWARKVTDLAINKVVLSTVMNQTSPPVTDLTDESVDYFIASDCPCTTNVTNATITVDLGKEYVIKRVTLTSSSLGKEAYFLTTEIYVRNTSTDAVLDGMLFGDKDDTPNEEYTTYIFDNSTIGRYVTILQTDTSPLCLCNIEIFGFGGLKTSA